MPEYEGPRVSRPPGSGAHKPLSVVMTDEMYGNLDFLLMAHFERTGEYTSPTAVIAAALRIAAWAEADQQFKIEGVAHVA